MPNNRTATYATLACALALTFVCAGLQPESVAARPASAERQSVARDVPGSVTATVGASTIVVEPRTPAIPVDGEFSYVTRITLDAEAESVIVRLKILNPSGRLMIQQTRIENGAGPGTVVARFERDMSDLQLSPGAYPAQLEVRVSQKGSVESTTVGTELLVYDARRALLPFALSARVTGQPLTDPEGRFVADPAVYTRARDDVNAIAAWVVTEAEARITLALSPLLLSEWAQVAAGYVLVSPEGVQRVPPDSPTATSYGATLALLKQAIGTGRLELTTQGFADPDLAALAVHEMIQDVDAHYAKGLATTLGSAETTPSTGTVPAGGCLPPQAGSTLARHGIEYAVVDQSCARFKNQRAAPGVYGIDGPPLRILVADDELSERVETGDASSLLRYAFDRAVAQGSRGPLVASCEVGPGAATPDAVFEAARHLAEQPWLRIGSTRELAARDPAVTVTLIDGTESAPAPRGYWSDVRDARTWSRALSAAVGDQTAAARTAEDDSLIAQSSAWTGPSGQWEPADRGRAFAGAAERSAREVLSVVDLRIESMTLAGSTGEVPVIITNNGDEPLWVDVVSSPSKGLNVEGDLSRRVELSPQDNFVELPVTMPDALRGELRVTISSAGLVLDRETIVVRASYLDRLVMIAGVILVLGVLLAFIIRRVRAAESAAPTDGARRSD